MAVFVWLFFAWPLLPPNLKTDSRSALDTKSSSLKLCTWKKKNKLMFIRKSQIRLDPVGEDLICRVWKQEVWTDVWGLTWMIYRGIFSVPSADGIYLIFLLINKSHFKFAVQLCCGWCRTLSYRIQYNTALFIWHI